jgi:hypothetical protein
MGLVLIAADVNMPQEASCDHLIYFYCGVPPYPTRDSCLVCTKNAASLLTICTPEMIMAQCNQTAGGGEITPPSQVSGMDLHLIS